MLAAIPHAVDERHFATGFRSRHSAQHADERRHTNTASDQHGRTLLVNVHAELAARGLNIEDRAFVNRIDEMVRNHSARHALHGDAEVVRIRVIRNRIAPHDGLLDARHIQAKRQELPRPKQRQRLAVVREEVERVNVVRFLHLALHDELAVAVPAELFLFALSPQQRGGFDLLAEQLQRQLALFAFASPLPSELGRHHGHVTDHNASQNRSDSLHFSVSCGSGSIPWSPPRSVAAFW